MMSLASLKHQRGYQGINPLLRRRRFSTSSSSSSSSVVVVGKMVGYWSDPERQNALLSKIGEELGITQVLIVF